MIEWNSWIIRRMTADLFIFYLLDFTHSLYGFDAVVTLIEKFKQKRVNQENHQIRKGRISPPKSRFHKVSRNSHWLKCAPIDAN